MEKGRIWQVGYSTSLNMHTNLSDKYILQINRPTDTECTQLTANEP